MIVVHFICDLLEGGAQKSALSLIENTAPEVTNYLVLLEDRRKYEPQGVPIYGVTPNKKLYKKAGVLGDFILARKFLNILREIESIEGKPVDAIVSHMEVTAKVLYFIRHYCKIFYIRVNLLQELAGLRLISPRRAKRRTALYKKILDGQNIITVSKGVLEDLHSIPIKPRFSEYIYNAFDVAQIRRLAEDESVKIPNIEYIVHPTAYRNRQKRHDILFQALKLMRSNIKVVILSEPVAALKEMIEKYDVAERVIVAGFHSNPYPIIKNARLTVLSSEREGLPRALVESIALGIPVVSTNCPSGPKEIMSGELSAYLAKVNDPEDLAAKLDAALIQYPEIKEEYLEPYNRERNTKKFMDYLSAVKE